MHAKRSAQGCRSTPLHASYSPPLPGQSGRRGGAEGGPRDRCTQRNAAGAQAGCQLSLQRARARRTCAPPRPATPGPERPELSRSQSGKRPSRASPERVERIGTCSNRLQAGRRWPRPGPARAWPRWGRWGGAEQGGWAAGLPGPRQHRGRWRARRPRAARPSLSACPQSPGRPRRPGHTLPGTRRPN